MSNVKGNRRLELDWNGEQIMVSESLPPETRAETPTAYFFHGIGDTSASFEQLIDKTTKSGFQCITCDLPGFGCNSSIHLCFDDLVNFCQHLIRRTDGERPRVFVGHSFGGLLLLLCLQGVEISDDDKVVVIEGSLTEADYGFFKWINEPPVGIGFEEFLARGKRREDPRSRMFFPRVEASNRDVFLEYAKTVYSSFWKFREKIKESSIEFYYIMGEESIGKEKREEIGEDPCVSLVRISNAQHWVHLDNPEEFFEWFASTILR